MKRRVLFVDDEPHVLAGLRNRLRGQRDRWEMRFADGGEAALEILGREPIDVIVTDMRMPRMDGATLLTRVQELDSRIVRIVLSGHAELEAALRAVPVAHQFLSKPCEAGVIEDVVDRACSLQALINDDVVRRAVGRIAKLPSRPRVYTQLMELLARENVTSRQVADVLKQDMAICAKTLQIVNSAFFRLSRTIMEVDEAVAYLGLTTIKQVALAAEVFHHGRQRRRIEGHSLEELQEHAILVGQMAAELSTGRREKEDAFVAGLLHDIGKLLLLVELPDLVANAAEVSRRSGRAMHDVERELWGATHAEVGGYLLGLWGLPYPMIEAVANHHLPWRVPGTGFGILGAVYVADELARAESARPPAVPGQTDDPVPTSIDMDYLRRLGVGDRIGEWQATARRLMAERCPLG